ncbi:MAG: DUF58 domain-containing protein [Actinomycetota bacterium]
MLTRSGWAAGALSIVLIAAGRILGVFDLFVIGAVVGAVLLAATIWVAMARIRLSVDRTVRPARVHAGDASRVELAVTNVARRRTPVLQLTDPVTGTPGATAEVGPVKVGQTSRLAYQLPTERRGVLSIGPLRLEISDPLGLASVKMVAAPRAEVTVYPRIHPVTAVATTLGNDAQNRSAAHHGIGRVGDDFYALRDYVVGDDLRRVHWPTTARRGEIMVRQDELPWQGKLTLLLDLRRSVHTPGSFELAVSAAASLLVASSTRHDLVRLRTTDGGDSGFGAGHAHLDAIMEYLATTSPSGHGSLRSVLSSLRSSGGGAFVGVTANGAPDELGELLRTGRSFASVYVIDVRPSAWDPAAPPDFEPERPGVVTVHGGADFATAWERAVRTGGRMQRATT